jgi:hypothetical protein
MSACLCKICWEREAMEPTGDTIDCAGGICFQCHKELYVDKPYKEKISRLSDEALKGIILERMALGYW